MLMRFQESDPWCRRRVSSTLLTGVLLTHIVLSGALLTGCSPDQETRLSEVRTLQSAGQLGRAISALEQVLANDAEHPEANFMLGKALLQTDQPRLAISALEKAAANERYAQPAGLLLASTLFGIRDYDGAIGAANRVLESDPKNPTALLTRGRSQLRLHRPGEALADANDILDIDANHQNASRLKGGALIDLGRRDEAESVWINLYTRLSTLGSPNQAARACGQLALFYRTQKDFESADRTYQKCLETYPTHAYLQRWASDFYVSSGQSDRAIELHRQAIEASPDDLRLRARLANVLLGYGEQEDAQQTLEDTIERFDSPEAWRLLADFYKKTGDDSLARQMLEEAIHRTPEPQDSDLYPLADLFLEEGDIERAREIGARLTEPSYQHLLEGAILLNAEDAEGALEHFDASLAIWPRNPRARYLAGMAAQATGDGARAEAEFRRALAIGSGATNAALRIAEIEFARGRADPALKSALRQIAMRPFSDATPYRIAIASALELGKLDTANKLVDGLRDADPDGLGWLIESTRIKRYEGGARAASEHVLTNLPDVSDPSNEAVLRDLVEDLNQLGRADEGLDYVEAALARGEKKATLHDLRARALSHLERFDEAESSIGRALQLDPTYAPAFEIKAFLALERGDREGALAALDEAAAMVPGQAQYSYAAASIARESGNHELAIAYLEEALSRRPGFAAAANDLAWLLADEDRDLDRALELAQRSARRNPSPNTLDTLGWVRYQRGEFREAISSYRSALEREPGLPAVQYRLGLSLSALGETEEARRVLGELLHGPEFPELEKARAELARLGDS
jgi:tetratricopeptide (TPR) repeat protein